MSMNEITVLAIDQSSRACGLAVVRGRALLWSDVLTFATRKQEVLTHSGKRRVLAQRVFDLLQEYRPDYIVLEQPRLFASRKRTPGGAAGAAYISRSAQRVLDRLVGAVADVVYPQSVYVLDTQRWKYAVLGNRAATKADAIWYVAQAFGKVVKDDEADAICMGVVSALQPELLAQAE